MIRSTTCPTCQAECQPDGSTMVRVNNKTVRCLACGTEFTRWAIRDKTYTVVIDIKDEDLNWLDLSEKIERLLPVSCRVVVGSWECFDTTASDYGGTWRKLQCVVEYHGIRNNVPGDMRTHFRKAISKTRLYHVRYHNCVEQKELTHTYRGLI